MMLPGPVNLWRLLRKVRPALRRPLVVFLAPGCLRGIGPAGHAHCGLAPSHELHPLRDHLAHVALLAVLRLPVARLQPSFHHDGAALVEILAATLSLFSPHHDGEETDLIALL